MLIDQDRIFELNNNMNIEVRYIFDKTGVSIPVVVIDNFYKNPDLVRNLIRQAPIANRGSKESRALVGYRTYLFDMMPYGFYDKVAKIVSSAIGYEFNLIEDNSFQANVIRNTKPIHGKRNRYKPHEDSCDFAMQVYMNKNDEPVGGTSLFIHKNTGRIGYPTSKFMAKMILNKMREDNGSDYIQTEDDCNSLFDLFKQFSKTPDGNEFLLTDDEDWSIAHTIDNKYNRFVMYPGSAFHAPEIDKNVLNTAPYDRIAQVAFLRIDRDEIRPPSARTFNSKLFYSDKFIKKI